MIKACNRSRLLASVIQKKIANILQRYEIKNLHSRKITTISGVKVSYDLAYAKVYVTFMNVTNKNQVKNNIKALHDASGYIRTLLSKSIHLRIVPELTFFYDNSFTEGMRISNLVTSAIKYDEERRRNK